MKIKKPMKVGAPGADGRPAGGAAIADRLRLDAAPAGARNGATVGKTAVTCAFTAGLISLALIAALAGLLYAHWDYLMPV